MKKRQIFMRSSPPSPSTAWVIDQPFHCGIAWRPFVATATPDGRDIYFTVPTAAEVSESARERRDSGIYYSARLMSFEASSLR